MATPEQAIHVSRLAALYGLKTPVHPVCVEHQSPAQMLAQLVYDRPDICLWQGPRGGGKSLTAGLSLYLLGILYPEFQAKILGGSLAQSAQIYNAMDHFRRARPEADAIREMLKTEATFRSGAHVEMLTASPKSVRGPHVPQINLDEVDEIEDDIREHAAGMAMRKGRLKSSIVMTSTWHHIAGPMASLVARGKAGEFPVGTFCMFDVLERCPDERSGPDLENCPACPLVEFCHSDRDRHPSGLPKAKRSCGHYDIDALIQKTKFVSRRVFGSDYLCEEPRPQGMWFKDYDEELRHVREAAEYDPAYPFHVSIDCGNCTGAVWLQVRRDGWGNAKITVFGDYFSENIAGGAEANATAIVARTRDLTGNHPSAGRVSMDSAGRQRTPIGVTVVGEYQRAGCIGRNRTLEHWPELGQGRPKSGALALTEAMLLSADGTVSLTIHPRCEHLRRAFKSYVRKRTPDGQWLDDPLDPQHPAEDLIDPITGALNLEFPEGRRPEPRFARVHAGVLS